MPALHDFRCTVCDHIFERVVRPEIDEIDCEACGKRARKTFERFDFRKHLEFPEGPWHGLPEEDGHPPDIRSRRQLREYLNHAGTDLEDLVKVTVTLKRGENFDEMKPVFREYFPNGYPARNTILVDAFLNESIRLQIEGTAYKPR